MHPDPEIVHAFQNKSYTLNPAWLGGSAIRIDIAPGEIIWISYRSDYGFDSSLPGHGILVEQQDLFFGDMESNLVNTDPTKPWAKVVEADGNDAYCEPVTTETKMMFLHLEILLAMVVTKLEITAEEQYPGGSHIID